MVGLSAVHSEDFQIIIHTTYSGPMISVITESQNWSIKTESIDKGVILQMW